MLTIGLNVPGSLVIPPNQDSWITTGYCNEECTAEVWIRIHLIFLCLEIMRLLPSLASEPSSSTTADLLKLRISVLGVQNVRYFLEAGARGSYKISHFESGSKQLQGFFLPLPLLQFGCVFVRCCYSIYSFYRAVLNWMSKRNWFGFKKTRATVSSNQK